MIYSDYLLFAIFASFLNPLRDRCNLLPLMGGIFSENLKIAKAIPALKSGDQQQFVIYQPVFILSYFSKTFAGMTLNKIQCFSGKRHILSDA